MLKLKSSCERCGLMLEPASTEAFICSFECTFCKNCTEAEFKGVCPNCSGQLLQRPIRPAMHLAKNPSNQA